MSAAPPRHYQLFGLRVASDVELPEALPDEESATSADLVVRLGPIELAPTAPGISVVDGALLLLTVPQIARYLVRDGCEILIDRCHDAPDRNVRLYLLGSAIGAALHQRGLLPLHANAVEIDGTAVAFVGESGAGKSTLAGWFHDRRHRVLSDDVCVVHGIETGRPMIFPAVRRLRLWRDALLASGRSAEEHDASYSGDPDFDKFDVPLPSDAGSPVPLSAIVLLKFGAVDAIERVQGVEAAQVLFDHTYRGAMVEKVGNTRLHWQAVTNLLPKVLILKWTRPRDRDVLETGVQALVGTLRELVRDRSDQAFAGQVR